MPGQVRLQTPVQNQPTVPAAISGRIAGDGVHLVGRGVRPGRYTTTTAVPDCRWTRLAGAAGERRVLTGGTGSARRTTVTIRRTDTVFRTADCGTWVRR